MADKKDERTLEMRVAELETRLGSQQVEFTEEEVAAYNKIADALGVGAGAEPASTAAVCRVQTCRIQPCRIQPCRIQPCRIQPCRIQPCRIQPCRIQVCRVQQCINECGSCFASEFEDDFTGGFGTLGY
jgi:hypothetical protein